MYQDNSLYKIDQFAQMKRYPLLLANASSKIHGRDSGEWDAQTLRGAKSAPVVGIMGPITEALIIPWGISLSSLFSENIWKLRVETLEKNRSFTEKTI